MCSPTKISYPEYQEMKLMIWDGRKAIFSCDQCEKCNSTNISQIRFRGDDKDKFEIYMSNSYLPITGKILMRCKDHRINENLLEVDTIYYPNTIEIPYGNEVRRIQGVPRAETVISHDFQRDSIIFDENDFVWLEMK